MLEQFQHESYFKDIEDMSADFGSSWNFSRICQFHIRHIRALPSNMIRFGARSRLGAAYLPPVEKLFNGCVYDPDAFPPSTINNICVIKSIALAMFLSITPITPREIKSESMNRAIQALKYQHVLDPFPDGGVSATNFRALERANSPIPLPLIQLIPELGMYSGIAINLFRPKLSADKSPKIYIFPTQLSVKHQDPAFLQVDLLKCTPELLAEPTKMNKTAHVLTIPHLARFLALRNPTYRLNAHQYRYICRHCLSIFVSIQLMNRHNKYCNTFPVGGRCQPRRSRNIKVHIDNMTDPATGQQRPNGLFYKRGHLYRAVRPLISTFYDSEAITEEITTKDHPNAPNSAYSQQRIFSLAYVHASLYNDHKLTNDLSQVRSLTYDPHKQDERHFHITFLKLLKQDLIKISEFVDRALESDIGPPIFQQMTNQEKNYFMTKTNCDLCDRRFGTKYFCKTKKQWTMTVRQADHDHFVLRHAQSGYNLVLCSACNLNRYAYI